MTRPTFIDLNTIELNYYQCRVSLDKCNGSSNAVNYLSTKIYVPSERKNVKFKVFNVIKRRNEVKTLVKYISCDYKCKFNIGTCNSNEERNNGKSQCESKKYCT